MKDALRTRLEFLWAKIAGRDVDIDTLTPDAPTNMIEKLMIETADRIADAEQGGGGGGVTFVGATVTHDAETDYLTLDKTAAEIISAFQSGSVILRLAKEDSYFGLFKAITILYFNEENIESYEVYFDGSYLDEDIGVIQNLIFCAEAESDYPKAEFSK